MKRLLFTLCMALIDMSVFAFNAPVDTTFSFVSDTVITDSIYTVKTEGTEFWFSNFFNEPIGLHQLELLLSSKNRNILRVENPNTGWAVDSILLDNNGLTKITIPMDQGYSSKFDGTIQQQGLVVYSLTNTPFSAYASNFERASFDATNILPVEALSNEYVIQTYIGELYVDMVSIYADSAWQSIANYDPYLLYHSPNREIYTKLSFNEQGDSVFTIKNYYKFLGVSPSFHTTDTLEILGKDKRLVNVVSTDTGLVYVYDSLVLYNVKITENVPAYFGIVAIDDNTSIQITPNTELYNGEKANVPYVIKLNKGETYQIVSGSQDDLSGTHILSDKNIAVFNGNVCALVPDGIASCDHLIEQALPLNMWGKTFVTSVCKHQTSNHVKITALNDNTSVFLDGQAFILDSEPVVLGARQTVEIPITDGENFAHIIETSDLALCNLYFDGANSAGNGDPSMVCISPVEQRIKEKTFATLFYNVDSIIISEISNDDGHFLNVVTATENLDLLTINNEKIAGTLDPLSDMTTVGTNDRYTCIRKHLPIGTYTLHSDSGFNAYVYGIGSAETYAYNVGAYLEWTDTLHLNQFAKISWDIDTLCSISSLIKISYDIPQESIIDSVRYYAAYDKTISHFSTSPVSHSEQFIAHHIGVDTLYTFAYYQAQDTLAVKKDTILFGAKFSANTIHQKWNDFIGVLTNNDEGMYSNGGYNFISYQWYRNDSVLLGETNSYLYQDLIMGASYSALLTTADGVTSMTCPIIAEEKTDITPFPTIVNIAEMLRSPISQNVEMKLYSVTGLLVAHQSLTSENPEFHAPNQQGNYIVQFTTAEGMMRTYKLIVK